MVSRDISVTIARARCEDVTEVHKFHQSQATEFIWPRTVSDLRGLADDGSLIIAFTTNITAISKQIIGMCYVMKGDEPEGDLAGKLRWEFGGVCVSNNLRGYGLGSAISTIAISSHCVLELPQNGARLIAHVHEDNDLPRRMLEKQLGFIQRGQEIPPSEIVPSTLRRNAEGNVVGDLYVFQAPTLSKFADWLEAMGGKITGKMGDMATDINISLFKDDFDSTIIALRDLAEH